MGKVYLVTQTGAQLGCSIEQVIGAEPTPGASQVIVQEETLPGGTPKYWHVDGGLLVWDSVGEQVAILAAEVEAYYNQCYAFQRNNIDANLQGEMDKSEALVEGGGAVEGDLPMAKANWEWLDALYAFYYTEKASTTYSLGFLGAVGSVPYSHADVRGERKDFLAGA